MATKWHSTKYPGIRYREHNSRKFGVAKDRYYSIYYRVDKKTREEGLGWSSQGWTIQKANEVLCELKLNSRTGDGPQSLAEKKNLATEQRHIKELKRLQENKKSWKDDRHRFVLHIQPFLGHEPLGGINPFLLERLKKNLSGKKRTPKKGQQTPETKKLSPATIKHCLALIRRMFNKARNWELFDGANPVQKIKLPSTANQRRLRFLSYAQANELLAALKVCSTDVHDQSLLALHCGLRFGEIAKLTWPDIDFNHGIIQVRDPKSENRQAFMTPAIREVLETRRQSSEYGLLFPNRTGGRQKSVSKTFERTVNLLKLNVNITDDRDKVVFHTLRHTFASWLAREGTPILAIKELMGHKSIEMTMRYAHLSPDVKQQAVNAMFEAMKQAASPGTGETAKNRLCP